MRRLSNLTAVILLLMAFGMTGCSSQYQSERYLYRASKLARNIVINPEAIPPQEFDRAVKAYEVVFERYPDTQSAGRARLGSGFLFMAKEQYGEAREVFGKVLELYPDNKKISAEAQFAIAKSYERGGEWHKALLEYNKLIASHPKTGIGLSLPMYIAAKENFYSQAIVHYKKIAEENPDTIAGFRAENFIVIAYLKEKNWYEAVNALEKLIMDYPQAKNLGLSLRMIADISAKRLEGPEMAIGVFERFLDKYPGHVLKDGITEGMEAIRNVSAGE